MTTLSPEISKAPAPIAEALLRPHRFAGVDGLRAVACLAVVMHHCYYHAGQYQWPLGLPRLFGYGYLGVDVFFVISGFCLAYPFLGQNRPRNWRAYAAARVRRIFPAYWAALLLFVCLSVVIHRFHIQPFDAKRVLRMEDSWPKQLILSIPLYSYCLNDSFWTLALEARWYILLPLLLRMHRTLNDVGLFSLTIVVSLAFKWVSMRGIPIRAALLIGPLPLFLPLFAMGIIVARYADRLTASPRGRQGVWLCRAALILSLAAVARWAPPALAALGMNRILCGGLLAVSLLFLALHDPWFNYLLSRKTLLAVSAVSYSVYLIHEPLIHLAYAFTEPRHWPQPVQFLVYQCIAVPACVALGCLFHLLFERPFLRKRQPVVPQRPL